MEKVLRPRILLYQSVGFLAIIGLSWLDDQFDISGLILGERIHFPRFQASLLEIVFMFVVWLFVAVSTRRVLDRVRYLERFMKVCAWCRRIDYKGRWMPLEEFLEQGFDTPTSHGICQDCLQLQKEAAARAKQPKKHAGLEPGHNSA